MSTAKTSEAGEAGRLSRRDRAAMVLALECLRSCSSIAGRFHLLVPGGALYGAEHTLREGDHAARVLARATHEAAACVPSQYRILRARLALALRVLLRVGAGDFGTNHCAHCAASGVVYLAGEPVWCMGCGGAGLTGPDRRPVRPLWLDAPPHAAATGDRRDDSAARAAGVRRDE